MRSAPEFQSRVHVIENGVDSEYFSPQPERGPPFHKEERAIVFIGAMDYWPNIDAVTWFAQEALPAVVRDRADARFYIVGMNPAPTVRALASHPNVVGTGLIPDVRPYLQHAAVVVAPIRVARGVQNKILEAMAMARPVVVSSTASSGIAGDAGIDFEQAGDGAEFAQKVLKLLNGQTGNAMGQRARARVQSGYSWERSMAAFDELLVPRANAAGIAD